VMTGFAFPEILLAMLRAREDPARAFCIYRQYLPLIVYEQQPGVAIRKRVYQLRGLIRSSRVRHPGADCDPDVEEQVADVLRQTFPGRDLSRALTISIP